MQNDEVMYKHHLVIKHIDSYTEKKHRESVTMLVPLSQLRHLYGTI